VINAPQIAAVVAQVIHVLGLAAGGILGSAVGLPIRSWEIRKWSKHG